ncbi:MAG: hypothetical protein WBA77_17185 [Microcoleaceae cyanobacterium]
MRLLFENTASALCYSIIHHRCENDNKNTDFPHNRIVQFVLQQHQRMPDYLKLPIFLLTILFNIWGFFRSGSLFHRQLDIVRWQQIESWKQSPISVFQDLIRFYESLVIFGWQAERYEQSKSND